MAIKEFSSSRCLSLRFLISFHLFKTPLSSRGVVTQRCLMAFISSCIECKLYQAWLQQALGNLTSFCLHRSPVPSLLEVADTMSCLVPSSAWGLSSSLPPLADIVHENLCVSHTIWHMCLYVCGHMHVMMGAEVKGQLVGVCSLPPPYGFRD